MQKQPLEWPARASLDQPLLRRFKQVARHKEHFYTLFLGLSPPDTSDLLMMLETGLPYKAWEQLSTYSNISQETLMRLTQISRSTLYRRKRSGRFESLESERLLRVARVFGEVMRYYDGDLSGTLRWLAKPQRALEGKTPFELTSTEVGARAVEDLIFRRAHGVIS